MNGNKKNNKSHLDENGRQFPYERAGLSTDGEASIYYNVCAGCELVGTGSRYASPAEGAMRT